VATDEPGGLESGHGTFVAGLVHLAAPDAELVAYRVADADGYGDGFTLARAIERNRRARQPTNYSNLRIPLETQGYVPKLQAVKNIVREPARFGIELANIPNEPYFVVVPKTRDIDLATAARLAQTLCAQQRRSK
jgi:hypothetical protein